MRNNEKVSRFTMASSMQQHLQEPQQYLLLRGRYSFAEIFLLSPAKSPFWRLPREVSLVESAPGVSLAESPGENSVVVGLVVELLTVSRTTGDELSEMLGTTGMQAAGKRGRNPSLSTRADANYSAR